ncbi:hypothetical protein OBBRIDRAFT_797216 [Obba rivulosa]|uniref:DUF6533 domain-containing protein n=1 Tax=Obba rivulosa TaxID=1052685 RepID=A0A8E2AKT1_9APHY|nr:hypothetical protein OBBRIDRAFT_797216 [Obba rivulosa]
MSLVGPSIEEEVISILHSFWIDKCCTLAGSALIVYDHLSTFSDEVEFIWGRKLNSVTLLFYLNRWCIFMWAVATLVDSWAPLVTLQVCIGMTIYVDTIALVLLLIWAAFSAIRMYAISVGNIWFTLTVLALNIVPVGTNVFGWYVATWYIIDTVPDVGTACASGKTISNAANIHFAITTRVCTIVADLIVLLMTWNKTYTAYRNARRLNINAPLAEMLLKDGTAYFLILLSLNVIDIAGWTANVFVFGAATLTNPLSSIIISHFLLNLRQYSCKGNRDTINSQLPSQNGSQGASIRFASFVDNMGEPVDHGMDWTSDLHSRYVEEEHSGPANDAELGVDSTATGGREEATPK